MAPTATTTAGSTPVGSGVTTGGITSPGSTPSGPAGVSLDPASSDPNVFFFEDFESAAYETHFTGTSHPQNRSLATTNPFEGQSCFRFFVPQGGHYGGSLIFDFTDAGMPEPEELYGRYYLRFGPTWDPTSGGKLPGPSGTYGRAGWGGRPVDGSASSGWSARMGFKNSSQQAGTTRVSYYTYHADMTGQYGSSFEWDLANRGMALENDRWYCVETYVRMNTPGLNDGILRGWIDGELALDKTDLRFRDVDSLKVERFWMNIYYGGNWTAPVDMEVFFDNVALSTRPIGVAR